MRLPRRKLVAGLDLARRSDHSALVLLDVEAHRLTVSAALRLPQAPLRQQFALIAPHLAGLDLLVFDQSGLGDAAAELLPKTPPHVGVCLIGGDREESASMRGPGTAPSGASSSSRRASCCKANSRVASSFMWLWEA